ncbi:hypothetical protein [Mycobacterium avium]|uniref:hypothetical protein n=1 Tax=Mycobacterium avium TaxID=1764 RepID=UPI001CC4A6A5|nr:hypothetical protein [Mycobacterium avium]MBZ4526709.1 hypothetical protein [Mycobacterium avium subsp. hominissuis]MBZ4546014.1 hypothetical protein [Mycobacterium avium subsp. hominissuis]MBZ4557923.1 hypothetical protein [Mycobacterium avium subsp. hominissuis]MBZ4567624.1 hypothetical protein [Mycobacterium avium subsp. hominissuis]MBZ4623595.1 hypothetical protein [Mycobacterium avium subsp. hominissuis]
MGQYFIPVFLNDAGAIVHALDPSDYGAGNKISGHTRADTALLRAVLTLLNLDGALRLVWAGDYAQPRPGHDANLYFLTEPAHFRRIATLVCCDVERNAALPQSPPACAAGYVCNLDKRQYLDNSTLPVDDSGWRRTPLPLLTADGGPLPNDSYRPLWAGDRLHYSRRHPGSHWTAVT